MTIEKFFLDFVSFVHHQNNQIKDSYTLKLKFHVIFNITLVKMDCLEISLG